MAEHDHEHGHQGYQKGSLSLWGAVSLGTGVMIGAGIFALTGQVAQLGLIAFLTITAYISISLGFINLLPIPMLDGGHLMFYTFEKILGRPLTQKTQESFFRIGLFLLVFLMLFTTVNDLKDLGLF